MKKVRLSQYFIFIAVLTFITIFVFMVSKSYDSLMGPINQTKSNVLLKPIDPNLDVSTIKLIESKLVVDYLASPSGTINEN